MGKILMCGSFKGELARLPAHGIWLIHWLGGRKLGKKVLAVDFDSQANLTTCFE